MQELDKYAIMWLAVAEQDHWAEARLRVERDVIDTICTPKGAIEQALRVDYWAREIKQDYESAYLKQFMDACVRRWGD